MLIRNGTEGDLEWCYGEMLEFFKENPSGWGLGPFPATREVSDAVIMNLVRSGLFLVAESGGERAGLLMGTYGSHMSYPDTTVCQIIHWWVNPKFRNGTAAWRLIHDGIRQASQVADYLFVSIAKGSKVTENTMKRLKLRPAYDVYSMELT